MVGEKALMEKVKILQKQIGGVMKLVIDLKLTVEALRKKLGAKEIDEVKEIIMSSKSGCHRVDCKYIFDRFANEEIHVNLGNAKKQNLQEFECISCKCLWKDRNCVEEHFEQIMKVYFCLNCDDCVQNIANVLQSGWTILNEAGD